MLLSLSLLTCNNKKATFHNSYFKEVSSYEILKINNSHKKVDFHFHVLSKKICFNEATRFYCDF